MRDNIKEKRRGSGGKSNGASGPTFKGPQGGAAKKKIAEAVPWRLELNVVTPPG
jgi:hypothetical protein